MVVNLTERARWFWEVGGMYAFKQGISDEVMVERIPRLTYKQFSEQAFGDGPVRIEPERYVYSLWVQGFGADLFWGIVCEGRLVIGPHPYTGRDNLPLYPEDI